MSTVIGIDLGTTNTVVSVVRDGQASALPDEQQQTLIPSVVSFHPNGNVLVGRSAKERRIVDASNTIYSIKRLIGRSWDSEEVRRARARFPFEMREGPGQASLVVARGETYTLPEISAFVLRKAKSVAEAALGTSVDRAVITVPANFNDLQRAATKVAGRVAGLEVMRILNEPTAAALAYGYGRATSERVAVYDFGGGTFDVTLLDLSNNVFEVLATAGNTFLGGDDLDLAIAERMSELLLAQHRIDSRADGQVFERLRAAAETVKHRLSAETEVQLTVFDVGHGAFGKAVHFEFSMTRPELERLAAPIIDRTFDVCREALTIARLATEDFDQVLLVGGSTRVPLVRRRVEEFFKKPLRASVNPDEVVAIGAAIQASALSGAERRKGTIPPAPSPAVRQTQPSFSDAEQSLAARTALTSEPPVGGRPRLPSSPGIPQTQPFFGRQHVATHQGLQPGSSGRPLERESTLGVLGKASPSLAPPKTLGGLGPRQRIKTGPGLGPDAARATEGGTLVSATEEADRAQAVQRSLQVTAPLPVAAALPAAQLADVFGRAPEASPSPPAPAPREESVAFALSDADFLEVESAPARALAPGAAPYTPAAAPLGADDEASLPLPALPPDEEITKVGAPPEPSQPRAASDPSAAAASFAATWNAPPGSAERTHDASLGGFLPVPVSPSTAPAPLLIDVTPLTLSVETVDGFCDPVIERNTQVPCERTRVFVTATDHQTLVRVRVSQGQSFRFAENTLLGEIELSNLSAAPRGAVQIAVSFSLDTNGMLNVSAREVITGRATTTQLRLVALPEANEIADMVQRNAQRQF